MTSPFAFFPPQHKEVVFVEFSNNVFVPTPTTCVYLEMSAPQLYVVWVVPYPY